MEQSKGRGNMKIAMIGHKRVPSREGGIEIVVEELSVRLASMGHQVVCYNRWEDFHSKTPAPSPNYKGIQLKKVPTFKHSVLNAFVYSVLASVRAVCGNYDVIHFHAEGPAAMTFIPKIFGIPVVSTIHGLDWQRAKWGGFATKYLLWGEKNAARYSDALLVLSRGNQIYFRDTYGRKAICIPNGIEIKPYRKPEEISRLWGLEKNGYILFLARIVPEKGLHHLIEAYKKTDTKKRLVIAGELAKNNHYVSQICHLALEDPRILMTDFVEGRVLEELLSNCSLYVLPSDIEGMAISLLEALSYGVRCLVSDIEENVDASGGFAACFPRGDAVMLRIRLEELLEQDEEEHDREAQIEFVRKHYNWDKTVEELLNVYEEVIKKRRGMQ